MFDLNEQPFAWKQQKQSTAPLSNTIMPGTPDMPGVVDARDPTTEQLKSMAVGKGAEAGGNMLLDAGKAAYSGYQQAQMGAGLTAPLGTGINMVAPATEGLTATAGQGLNLVAPSVASSVAPLAGNAGAGIATTGAELGGTLGATLGTAAPAIAETGIAAATPIATGLGAGTSAATGALAAMGPVGWIGLGLLGAKAVGGK